MSVQRLILFCSTTSRACGPCIRFSYEKHLPIEIVRLDSPETRKRARRGKYFQIQVVPTLVVFREQGNLQLFAGQQKVLSWMNSLVAPKPVIQEPVDESSDEEDFVKPGMYDKKKKRKKKQTPIEDLDSEEEEVEIEFMTEPPPKDNPPPTGGLMVGPQATKSTTGSSIKELAKKMEEERKNSPWYREEN